MRRASIVVLLAAALVGCKEKASKHQEQAPLDAARAAKLVELRNTALALLEDDQLDRAATTFEDLERDRPSEALGPSGLGVVRLRQARYAEARTILARAAELAPNDLRIRINRAIEAELAGDVALMSASVDAMNWKESTDLAVLYEVARLEASYRHPTRELLAYTVSLAPDNIVFRTMLIEQLASDDPSATHSHLQTLAMQLAPLDAELREAFAATLEKSVPGHDDDRRLAITRVLNMLRPTDRYQSDLAAARGGPSPSPGLPPHDFTSATVRDALAALAESAPIAFHPAPREAIHSADHAHALELVDLDGDGDLDAYWLAGTPSRLFVAANADGGLSLATDAANDAATAVCSGDLDDDGRLELLVFDREHSFIRHASTTAREAELVRLPKQSNGATSCLVVDLDNDGDLDVLVTTPAGVTLLRHVDQLRFEDATASLLPSAAKLPVTHLESVDAQYDIDLDVLMTTPAGKAHLLTNERISRYSVSELSDLDAVASSVAIDLDFDGMNDLVTLDAAGALHARSVRRGDFAAAVNADTLVQPLTASGARRAICALDANNDGRLDLALAGTNVVIARRQKDGGFALHAVSDRDDVVALASGDLDGDGRVELVLLANDGTLQMLSNTTEGGAWLEIELEGLGAGSGKTSRNGIGARIEVRTGNFTQSRMVTTGRTHFGLGAYAKADAIRVVWPNGTPQNAVQVAANQRILERQVLKGSCPYLYLVESGGVRFLNDIHWRTALGMPLGIMSSSMKYAFADSNQEHFLLPKDMAPNGKGPIELRMTEELWETMYLDQAQLVSVDVPDGHELLIQEKFAPPPMAPLHFYVIKERVPAVSVQDHHAIDISQLVAKEDAVYAQRFERTHIQGVAETHWLTIDPGDLGARLPAGGEPILVLKGWIMPTDASLNVAIGQSPDLETLPPTLQVVDAKGQWVDVASDLGFPAGKDKYVVVALRDVYRSADRRLRIVTNMELSWDVIFFANDEGLELHHQRQTPTSASVRFRGLSRQHTRGIGGPQVPTYADVDTTARWPALTGDYTRYGNVDELVLQSDNRYVVISSGDEIQLNFAPPGEPAPGHHRRYLIYTDGWLKDGDLNTNAGQTVEPLPFHGMTEYPYDAAVSYPDTPETRAYRATYQTRRYPTHDVPVGAQRP